MTIEFKFSPGDLVKTVNGDGHVTFAGFNQDGKCLYYVDCPHPQWYHENELRKV